MRRLITSLFITFICTLLAFNLDGQIQIGADILGAGTDDRFGNSVALSDNGNTVIVGAYGSNVYGNTYGYASVYEKVSNSWELKGSVIPGNDPYQAFGTAVTMSSDGNRIAISGSYGFLGGNTCPAGLVRVYEYDGTDWVQMGNDIVGTVLCKEFGADIEMSEDGNSLIVHSSQNQIAEVYEYNGTDWVKKGDTFFQAFYVSISGDGNTIGICSAFPGSISLYQWSDPFWLSKGAAIPDDGGGVGRYLDLDMVGNTLVTTAPFTNVNTANSGQIRVYEFSSGTWNQTGDAINGSVAWEMLFSNPSISDDGELITAVHRSGTNNVVRTYMQSGNNWVQTNNDILGNAVDDFGSDLSISGDKTTLIVGAEDYQNGTNPQTGFVRIFDLSSALPVTFTAFTATPKNQTIRLAWHTAAEQNNAGFTVQRSPDGRTWQNRGYVPGAGTTDAPHTYTHTDRAPLPGTNYYRLRQEDRDGTYTYSEIVSAQGTEGDIVLYPNPVRDELTVSGAAGRKLLLCDAHGRVLRRIICTETVHLLDLRTLPAGVYVLRAETGNLVRRVVKR